MADELLEPLCRITLSSRFCSDLFSEYDRTTLDFGPFPLAGSTFLAGMEDYDFYLTVIEQGWEIVQLPEAVTSTNMLLAFHSTDDLPNARAAGPSSGSAPPPHEVSARHAARSSDEMRRCGRLLLAEDIDCIEVDSSVSRDDGELIRVGIELDLTKLCTTL